MKCDSLTGKCSCNQGYSGVHCDQCDHGYYGYPKCKRCNCNIAGTNTNLTKCINGVCQCNQDGTCKCKVSLFVNC